MEFLICQIYFRSFFFRSPKPLLNGLLFVYGIFLFSFKWNSQNVFNYYPLLLDYFFFLNKQPFILFGKYFSTVIYVNFLFDMLYDVVCWIFFINHGRGCILFSGIYTYGFLFVMLIVVEFSPAVDRAY